MITGGRAGQRHTRRKAGRGVGARPGWGAVAGLVVGVVAVSTSAILIRVAEAPSLSLAFWRCAGGAAVLAILAVPAQRHRPALEPAQRRQLLVAGGLLAAHFALFVSSLSFTTVASSVVLVTSAPLFVGLGAAVFLGEPPSTRGWAGIAVATAGAVAVGVADVGSLAFGGRALLGDAMAFGGALTASGYLLVGRSARRRLPTSVYASAVYAVAAAALLAAVLASGTSLGLAGAGYSARTWFAIAGLIVGPQLLGHTVFNALLSRVSATVVAVAVLGEPVIATLLAWGSLGELPTVWFWPAGVLVLVGVYLVSRQPGGRPDRLQSPAS